MIPSLRSDDRHDFRALVVGSIESIGSEAVDVDYFLRRPRAAARGHRRIGVLGLFKTLRFRLALRSGLTVASAAR